MRFCSCSCVSLKRTFSRRPPSPSPIPTTPIHIYTPPQTGLPFPFNKSPRTPFNHPELLVLPLLRPIEKCLVSQDAWVVMRGYIDHVAEVCFWCVCV